MTNKKLDKFLENKNYPGNWLEIANTFSIAGTSKQKSDFVRRRWKSIQKNKVQDQMTFGKLIDTAEWKEFQEFKKLKRKKLPKPYLNGNSDNVLVIGDLHEPFCLEGYLEFCRFQQERFNCGKVLFIGDIIDHHAQSFHNTDPDGLSAKDELLLAVKKLQDWYQVFPKAVVLLGNHDRIVARKLFSVGLSQRWMKPLSEVLETPNWEFVEQFSHNNVLYVHGEGGAAKTKAQQEMISVVQGHSHSEGSIHLLNGGKNFAMQVGCGIDFEQYAFAYAQRGKKPIISCGAVLNNSPIIIPYDN